MTNYNYVQNPNAATIAANTILAPHPASKTSDVSQTANSTTDNASTVKNNFSNTLVGASITSYTNHFKEIFSTFQEIKEK